MRKQYPCNWLDKHGINSVLCERNWCWREVSVRFDTDRITSEILTNWPVGSLTTVDRSTSRACMYVEKRGDRQEKPGEGDKIDVCCLAWVTVSISGRHLLVNKRRWILLTVKLKLKREITESQSGIFFYLWVSSFCRFPHWVGHIRAPSLRL